MKVLYIGHYKEYGGWANAAQNLIRALNTADMEVVCRNVTLTRNRDVANDILELENKDIKNVDFCIQHLLPHHLIGSNKFKKNIAYAVFESSNLKYNMWMSNLKYMDEVWVPCQDNQIELIKANVENVHVIPHAFNMDEYTKDNSQVIDLSNFMANKSYKFYTIADLTQRKNLASIIRTYYSTFFPNDQVALIIKVNKFGYSATELYKAVHAMCENIRKSMRIYDEDKYYNDIIVIPEEFTNEQIKDLHTTCDCFISLSHGEAWSIPTFDAMCYGNHPIAINWNGPREYIDKNNKNTGWLVNYSMQTCSTQDAAFRHIFTGREFWVTPDEREASEAMRYYFENRSDTKSLDGYQSGAKYNLEQVGSMMKERLLT